MNQKRKFEIPGNILFPANVACMINEIQISRQTRKSMQQIWLQNNQYKHMPNIILS